MAKKGYDKSNGRTVDQVGYVGGGKFLMKYQGGGERRAGFAEMSFLGFKEPWLAAIAEDRDKFFDV